METSIVIVICAGVALIWAYVIINLDKKGKLLDKYREVIQLEFGVNYSNFYINKYSPSMKEPRLQDFLDGTVPKKDLHFMQKHILDKIITLVCHGINNPLTNELTYCLQILKNSIQFWAGYAGPSSDGIDNIKSEVLIKTNNKIFTLFNDYLSNLPNYIMIDAICDYLNPEKPTDEEGRLSTIFLITGYANRNPETPYRETAILIRNKKIQEFLDNNAFDAKNYKTLIEIVETDDIDPKVKTDGEKVLYQIALQAIDDLHNKDNIDVTKATQLLKDLKDVIIKHKQTQLDLQIAKGLGESINEDEGNFFQENPFV